MTITMEMRITIAMALVLKTTSSFLNWAKESGLTFMLTMMKKTATTMRITWTTLTTTKRERGRETMMRKREKIVSRREHTPGPSSQAENVSTRHKLRMKPFLVFSSLSRIFLELVFLFLLSLSLPSPTVL